MRVLHAVQRYPPAIGGAEGWCAGLARWQAARGYATTVLTLRAVQDDELWSDRPPPPGPLAVGAADRDGDVAVVRCAVRPPAGPAATRLLGALALPVLTRTHSPELYGRLLRAARSADVVHAHAVPGPHTFAAWLAARAARRPFVLTPHFHAGDPYHELPAVGWLLRRADALVVLTEAEAAAVRARGADPTRVVCATNAIAPLPPAAPGHRDAVRAALGIPPGHPLVCFVGRKHRAKGLDVLLAAVGAVRHRPAPLIVLAGPSTDWFEAECRAHPLPGGVLDLPVLGEAAKTALVAAADVLVLPSRHEAFGTVFLEAWALGTPVIGAGIPVVAEVLGPGGLTFAPGEPHDLAARIDEVLSDPAAARARVAAGRERAARLHTWDRVGAAVEAGYARAGVAVPALPEPAGVRKAASWS